MDFVLSDDNYYSPEANELYMSVSQYKMFAGTYCGAACEAAALARLKGEWEEEMTPAMMVGSYVDAWFSGSMADFQKAHPEIFKRDGALKSEFVKAEQLIDRAGRDKLFMKYMSGEKQVAMTGEIGGCKWKIRMDSYLPGKAIVDLKVMQSLTKLEYAKGEGYLDFIRYWEYDLQGAVYQEIVRQNTGKILPVYIAGISKEKEPDIEIINITQPYLDAAMSRMMKKLPDVLAVRNGKREPERCGHCDYCRSTKVLKHPIGIGSLTPEV